MSPASNGSARIRWASSAAMCAFAVATLELVVGGELGILDSLSLVVAFIALGVALAGVGAALAALAVVMLASPVRRLLGRVSADRLGRALDALLLLSLLAVVGVNAWWPVATAVVPARLPLLVLLFLASLARAPAWASAFGRRGPASRPLLVLGVLALLGAVAFASRPSDTARRALLASDAFGYLHDASMYATDVDLDGYSALFGADCEPFDGDVHPRAMEVAGDGVDQNCAGGDPPARTAARIESDPALREAGAQRRRGTNVLLVTIDTLRQDHVGFAGYRRNTTPNLDALAARGLWFERCYSPGIHTNVSMPSIATGGGRGSQRQTLTSAFAGAGYSTAMASSLAPEMRRWGGIGEATRALISARFDSAGVTDEALRWLDAVPDDRPWLLWVHYMDPHLPYQPAPGTPQVEGPSSGDASIDAYDGDVRAADVQLGRLLEHVRLSGALDQTIVAVTSDHGEGLSERGIVGHGGGVFENLLRVPCVLSVPGGTARRVPAVVSSTDLAPTLVDLVGLEPLRGAEGVSLMPWLAGRPELPADRVVFASAYRRIYAAVSGRYKLVRDERRNLTQLVDLVADPLERRDAHAPAEHARLRAAYADWRDREGAPDARQP